LVGVFLRNVDIGVAVAVVADESVCDFHQSERVLVRVLILVVGLQTIEYSIVNVLVEGRGNELACPGQFEFKTILYLIIYLDLLLLGPEDRLIVGVEVALEDGLFG
jgi:hypothetical protein